MGIFTHTSTLLLPNPSLSVPHQPMPVYPCCDHVKGFSKLSYPFPPPPPPIHLQYKLTFILLASWYKLISACFVSVRTIVFNNTEYCIKALLFPLLSFALLSPYCSSPPHTLHLPRLAHPTALIGSCRDLIFYQNQLVPDKGNQCLNENEVALWGGSSLAMASPDNTMHKKVTEQQEVEGPETK